MSTSLDYSYWKEKGIQEYGQDGTTFGNEAEVINHFGYPNLGHIQAGTLMCFGGYNSRENTQGVPGRIPSSIVDRLGSENTELIGLLQAAFEKQYPIFAGCIGGDDLHRALHEDFKSYKLRKVLPVIVSHVLSSNFQLSQFEQSYFIGSRTNGGIMTLVGNRSGLYTAFKKVFGYEFPRTHLYPIIQQNQEMVTQWRKDRKLPILE